MKKQIRNNVFETNSSSTHAMSICSRMMFDKWQNGDAFLDKKTLTIVSFDDMTSDEVALFNEQKENFEEHKRYISFDEFNNCNRVDFQKSSQVINGEEIITLQYEIYQ